MCVFFPGDRVLAHRPNPQPGGPVHLSLSGCSPFDLSGKGGPTSSYTTAGIALWIIAPRKPPYPAKYAFVKVETPQGGRNIDTNIKIILQNTKCKPNYGRYIPKIHKL